MNATTARAVTVTILNKEYQVACAEEEEADLVASAAYLDKQMRAIQGGGKVIGLDRIAVTAALNISFELLRLRKEVEATPDGPSDEEVEQLSRKVDKALATLSIRDGASAP